MKGVEKVEKVQERSFKFIYNDYDKRYFELLKISKKPSLEGQNTNRKTLNDSNPVFMKDIVYYFQNKSHRKHNFHAHSSNTSRYGNNSFQVLCAHIWNPLPEHVQFINSVYELKDFLKGWYGCKCYLCVFVQCNYVISSNLCYFLIVFL